MRVTDERRIAFLLSLSAELSVGCRPRGAIRSHSTGNDRVRSPTSRTLGSNLWNKRGPAARRGIGAGLLGGKRFVVLSFESHLLDQDRALRDDRWAVDTPDSAADQVDEADCIGERFSAADRTNYLYSAVVTRRNSGPAHDPISYCSHGKRQWTVMTVTDRRFPVFRSTMSKEHAIERHLQRSYP